MRVIKFPLQVGWNTLEAEGFLEPLSMEWQNGFVVWCKEFTSMQQVEPLKLYLATTGEPLPEHLIYVATAMTPEGMFVVHLFGQEA